MLVVALDTSGEATLGNGFCGSGVCRNYMSSSFGVLDPSALVQVVDVVTSFVVLAVDCISSWLVW